MSPRLTNAIGWSATIMWVVSNVLAAIPSLKYEPAGSIGIVMAIVAGAAFADRGIRKAIEVFAPPETKPPNGGTTP